MYFFDSDAYITKGTKRSWDESIQILKDQLDKADAVVIGAGSGLSTAAGYIYTGERFNRYFSDFEKKYGFHDMYSGGFYPYASMEEFWLSGADISGLTDMHQSHQIFMRDYLML